MSEFKLIEKDTDFSKLPMRKLSWDTYVKGVPYDVYDIEGYIHTEGGTWGENSYWAFPRGEVPSYENAYEFMGHICNWSFKVDSNNYYKSKWGEDSIRSNYFFEILRNDKVFYSFSTNNLDYGIAKVRKLMIEIPEHPIPFNEQNFQNQIIGRKIYWREQPAIIQSYSMNGNLFIVPDGIPSFKKCAYEDNVNEYMSDDEDREGIAEDIFAPSIYWFRNRDYNLS
jgi:hypothetical protein